MAVRISVRLTAFESTVGRILLAQMPSTYLTGIEGFADLLLLHLGNGDNREGSGPGEIAHHENGDQNHQGDEGFSLFHVADPSR